MKKYVTLGLLLFNFQCAMAQTYQWLPTNSPYASFRFEDVYFLNNDTGVAVHYYDVPFGGEPGYIMKTTNGGNTWSKVLDSTVFAFRSVGFTDATHGWVGTLDQSNTGADTNIIYKTVDGGLTWTGVDNLPGPANAGICGLRVINDSTIYGVGRYFGPAGFYKTTNNGQTWSYTDLNPYASGLVDLLFFNADTGFAIGNTGPSYSSGYGRVLYTTDGGTTWSIVHTSPHQYSLGWKITFPSRQTGYVSMQFFSGGANYFLKTTDGGLTWQDLPYTGGPPAGYNVEGMEFINDTTGWVGGYYYTFITRNGGATWTQQSWGDYLNRFRFLSDSTGYSAGQRIYKMRKITTGIAEVGDDVKLGFYPNPATDFANFEFALHKSMRAKLSVYAMTGKEVELVFDKMFSEGNQHFMWKPGNLAPGVYTCVLTFGDQVIKRKLDIFK